MISDLESTFSANARGMKKSVIRELLKLTRKPEIISFAGGLPNPTAFPVQEVAEITADIMKSDGATALQYSPTEGDPKLKEQIIAHHARQGGPELGPENVLVTVASQQGLDLIAKIFVDRGDEVIVGVPTYVGGLGAFRSYGANMIGVPVDADGMDMDGVERELERARCAGTKPKFVYVIPDFQNPAGITLSEERRRRLIDIAHKYDVLIVEDSPYRELRFEGETVPTIYSLDGTGQVVALHTFSKILFPGMRLGWVVADEAVIAKLVTAKQSTDLCTPAFNQAIVAEIMSRGILYKVIEKVKALYLEKRDHMLAALEEHMPKLEGLSWTRPKGGLFLWVTLPSYMDTEQMFYDAVKNNVAFVIGSAFDPAGGSKNCMRLNFSYPSDDEIVEGVKRLAGVVEQYEKARANNRGVVASP